MSRGLESFKDIKTILLTTYKGDGTPVATPVSIAFDGSTGTCSPSTGTAGAPRPKLRRY
jgi:hypothetical protein